MYSQKTMKFSNKPNNKFVVFTIRKSCAIREAKNIAFQYNYFTINAMQIIETR